MIYTLDLLSDKWLELMWRVTWQGGVFIIAVFLITKIFRSLSPTIKHLLWMLVIVKFLVMPFVVVPITVAGFPVLAYKPTPELVVETSIAPLESGVISEPSATFSDLESPTTAEVAKQRITIDWPPVLFSFWLFGVLTLLLGVVYRSLRLKREISAARVLEDSTILRVVEEGARELRVQQPLLKLSDKLKSPLACGILCPTLIFPEHIVEKFSPSELRTIINHELAHIKRLDIFTNWIQIIAQVFYFFNPLLWYANRQIRLEREQACDDWVLQIGKEDRKRYADALVKVVKLCSRGKGFALGIVGVSEPFTLMARRLKMIMNTGRRISTRLSAKVIIGLVVIGLVGMPAYAVMRKPSLEAVEEERTVITKEKAQPQGHFVARGVLSGRITSETGEPVTDAVVQLYGPSHRARTDENGVYYFEDLKKPGEYQISISSKKYVGITSLPELPRVRLQKDSQEVRHFTLRRACQIKVQVVDETESPLADVELGTTSVAHEFPRTLMSPFGKGTIPTDQDGLAIIGGLKPAEEMYLITARKKGYAPSKVTVTLNNPSEVKAMRIMMRQGVQVRGQAICSDGKPATGWRVVAEPEWWHAPYLIRGVLVDEDGYFTLEHIVPGSYSIQICIPLPQGEMTKCFQVMQAELPSPNGLLEVKVPELSPSSLVSISGTVVFVGGQPSKGFHVMARSEGGKWYGTDIWGKEREFEIAPLPPGIYELRFQSPEFEEKRIKGVRAPAKGLNVKIECRGKLILKGMVVDRVTGKPIEKFKARVTRLRRLRGPNYVQDNRWHEFADPEGRFEIQVVGPGIYQVEIAAEDFANAMSKKINTNRHKGRKIRVELSQD